MARALDLARRGEGVTFPNPIVGALLVGPAGDVIGEGFHQGGEHAEIVALKSAETIPPGSTLYVSLEPCNHHGKTAPCVDAVIAANISRVVFAAGDPNPIASGGAYRLREAGIEVIGGVLEDRAKFENRSWITKISMKRPRFVFKIASTMDGKIAATDGSSQWITSEEARADVALMRSKADAILTSTGTVLADDCLLTSKGAGKNPVRIVMGESEIPESAKIRGNEAETIFIKSHLVSELLECVTTRGFNQVLIESGPTFSTDLIRAGIIDEIVLFQAPSFLGKGANSFGDLGATNINDRLNFEISDVQRIGPDIKITLQNRAQEPMGAK